MKKRLNLNPKSIEKEKKKDHSAILISIYVVLTILLLSNALIIYLENNTLEKKNVSLNQEVSSYKNENGDYINVYNELEREKKFVNKVDSLQKDNKVWKCIKDIGEYVPNSIFINSINLTNGTITLGGIANNNNDVAILLANLQMSDLYKNADVVTMNNIQIKNEDIKENNLKDSKEKKVEKNTDKKISTKSAVEFNISIEGAGSNEKNQKEK
ncbi:PilN domain-containing protein [Clostridium sp.]|uniref:PilN domain-containing protein n=1 Tax=Clostridium sp. TaxID=1506 RepID=UPI002FCA7BA9